ncbi:MAG TPA: DUF1499 domain-containing protein [Trichocoleus sp.]|jgi:uncharacterized protein (DUF1499 family)
MFTAGLSLCFTLLLTLILWLGAATHVTAQTLLTVPAIVPSTATVQLAMGSKPLFSFSGKRPTNLGVKDGKLAVCPGSPNCVSSQAPVADAEHFIAPIAYKTAPEEAMASLKTVIQNMERTKIITDSPDYLYAEFTTALMGYVDDVEFYLDQGTGTIQVRSASRLGQSDLGVNRKRIETVRAKLLELDK